MTMGLWDWGEVAWPLLVFGVLSILIPCALFRSRKWMVCCREKLLTGESGLSYSASFVMALPVLLFLSLVWFEAGMLLLAKVACSQAAHAAARSAAVWLPMNQPTQADAAIKLAARLPVTPYGLTRSIRNPFPAADAQMVTQADYAAQAFAAISGDSSSAQASVIRAKFLDAARRTVVTYSASSVYGPSNLDGEVTVTVTFRPAVLFPGLAAVVQPASLGRKYHEVKSTFTLPAEYPRNSNRAMSITYSSPG